MKRSRAVILGLGGLGCPASLALIEGAAAARISLELILVDDDRVDRSNLARQTLYAGSDVGYFKVEAAVRSLRALVPGTDVQFVPLAKRFDEAGADELLAGADVLLDGTDSFETRFLANDRARRAGIPLVHGAVLGWTGQLLSIVDGGPCLRCLFEAPPPPGSVPACSEAGVAGPLCALVGAAMAAEAIKILSGKQLVASTEMIQWEGLAGRARMIRVPRDPGCPVCKST
jgi:molybdopterin/thiamine biosynthesis adenylyltransferase